MTNTNQSNDTIKQWGEQRPVTLDEGGMLRTPDGLVKPNTGASIADVVAIGAKSQTLSSWRRDRGIQVDKQIRLIKAVHMRYQHLDLDKITEFLLDFGMHVAKKTDNEVWFRGYGPEPYVYYACRGAEKKFLGGTFQVESYADLEKATRLPGSASIQKLEDAPGGGHLVTLHDPEGFPINLIYGQEAVTPGEFPAKVIYNDESEKPRVRKFNRFTPGPAAVHKLGHYGLCIRDFEQQLKWYTSNFNFAPSDFLYVAKDGDDGSSTTQDVATFMHIDRGQDPVDHHTFFMSTNKTSHVHHASFEVHDYDTQHLGHQWLAKKGYDPVWGIGRHILGSQIFDYWWDTSGNMIEHYADGDLVNEDTPIAWGQAGDESLAVWGPEVPKWFLE